MLYLIRTLVLTNCLHYTNLNTALNPLPIIPPLHSVPNSLSPFFFCIAKGMEESGVNISHPATSPPAFRGTAMCDSLPSAPTTLPIDLLLMFFRYPQPVPVLLRTLFITKVFLYCKGSNKGREMKRLHTSEGKQSYESVKRKKSKASYHRY